MKIRPTRTVLDWMILILVILTLNLPLINVVMTSLKDNATISHSPPVLLFVPTLMHYKDVFTSPTFLFSRFLVNSLFIALFSSGITVLICITAAYAVVRLGIGSSLLVAFVTNLRAIPLVIFAPSVYVLFKQLDLIDTRLGIVLIHILVNAPIALSLFMSFMQDIPREIEESARLDGANSIQILLKIIIPMISSPSAAIFILSFIYSWNEFLFALILSVKKSVTLTVGASLFITAWGVQWGRIAAATTLAVIPPFIFAFYVQRYLVEAFSGGLKE
ncbi:MAG: Binding-protein-dependent transport systems inner membrane component [Thermotoga sp. 50_1627]|nr:MAG: Binding-protein-dependent transport systems inner membrane component [Thermotoga sp. 50_64]KUK24606.1 MAG: Binding-protein-dependent transport systems inner membrane component [Thermotoga sp. 50_1627]